MNFFSFLKMKTMYFICCFFISSLIFSQPDKYIGQKKLYYGASYYPEAWDFEGIDEDIIRMKELNMNVMRMAEFSWALMEPEEGKYDFLWLHKVIDKLHANGIDVILGTPTATPPAWAGEKYPQIYLTNEEGIHQTHGGRRNCSYTSSKYRELSIKIIERMAKEFGSKPGVIGWQTDNEFGLEYDYSTETEIKWHSWLQQRFVTIDQLNKLWCTQLWSQTYSKFEQVPMFTTRVWHHPSLQFNWIRFSNDMIVEYQDLQINTIRKYSSLPITHDGMPGQKVNYEKLFKNLDFMAYNFYHSFEVYDKVHSNHDRMRGYGKGFFWLFETAPNHSGGGTIGNTWYIHQPNGSMRAIMWLNYAAGAQGSMFWLWKQQWAGQEMPHGAIISSWNKPFANYADLKILGSELNKTSDFLMNNPVEKAKIAMFWDHENLVGFGFEQYANGLNYYSDWASRFYIPLVNTNIHRDVISQSTDISNYKILFAPLMPYISSDLRTRLKQWVNEGGILILGPMSGYRSVDWTSFKDHAMGNLEDWIGINVESRLPIGTQRRPTEIPFMLQFNASLNLKEAEASLWSEALSTKTGTVLATYKNGSHNGLAAIIENKVGKGKVILLGTDPGKEAFQEIALNYAKEVGIIPIIKADKGVIIVTRKGQKDAGVMIVNICNEPKKVYLDNVNYTDLLSNKKISQQLDLIPYEVLILKSEKK